MKYYKKAFIIIFLVLFILFSPFMVYADDILEDSDSIIVSTDNIENANIEIYSKSAVIYERNSKTILYEKNSHEVVPMASTTKIMTCILILENCSLDTTVTVSSNAASTIGSRLGLSTNDKISVQDLLYGLMLCSGNDAATCLAETCSGSVEDFSILMNSKATELGLTSTSFVTPHGLDNDNHFTTAYDFAILTDYALNNPLFKQIVGTKYYTVTINGFSKQIHNTNELLGSVQGVYGVKTGYTSKAGRCLISAASRENLDIVVVVFGADTKSIRNNDSMKLINYAFSNFEVIDIASLINEKYSEYVSYYLPYVEITKSSELLSTYLENFDTKLYPVRISDSNTYFATLTTYDLEAPVNKDQVVGVIDIWINNSKIYSVNIYSSAYINRKEAMDYLLFFISKYKTFYEL